MMMMGSQLTLEGSVSSVGLYIGGSPFDGGAATSDGSSLGGKIPLNLAIVEWPIVGRSITR
jgi:hypothetical protein